MHRDDERLARLLRLIRRDAGLTQAQLATAAAIPLNDVKRIESGRAELVRLGRIRKLLASQDGRARLTAYWKGASADALLDARHAELVERLVRILLAHRWDVDVEVSFSEWGERGSIDVLGWNPIRLAAAVCEVKSVFGSLEEANRSLDAKVRLAPTIVDKKLGWMPTVVGKLLVVPNNSTVRRHVDRHSATMLAAYPARSREARAWLRDPQQSLSAIWFVSDGRIASSVSD